MSDNKQIKEYIRACEHMMKFFNKLLNQNIKSAVGSDNHDKLAELTDLRVLAKTKNWPIAIDEKISVIEHLRKFVETISVSLKGKNVLEFGCCDSELAAILKNECGAKKVVSYDLELCKFRQNTISDQGVIYTDNFRIVQQNSTYDIIVINDVLDHIEKPVYWLKQLNPLMIENSRIFIRFHPFTSRNGTHLADQMNKAYMHLVFSDDELATFGIANKFTRKITDLQVSYERFIEESGFKILNQNIKKTPVEILFSTDDRIANRIRRNLQTDKNINDIIEIEYIDYELMKS